MAQTIFASLCLPNREIEYVPLENVNFAEDVNYLKDEIAKKIDLSKEEIELMYEGDTLEDSDGLDKITPNTTVHVLKKRPVFQPYVPKKVYSSEDCAKIAKLFGSVTHTQINVQVRVAILQKISSEYPEFKRNLAAQAMIRDVILFHTLDKPEVVEKIAIHLPIICQASDFIVKTIMRELVKFTTAERTNKVSTSSNTRSGQSEGDNDLSYESSTSSEDENASAAGTSAAVAGTSSGEQLSASARISRAHLAAAVRMASSSNNSLSSIAQRQTASAASPESPAPSAPSTSTSATRIRSILSSDLCNAIASAIGSATTPPASNQETPAEPSTSEVVGMETASTAEQSNLSHRYEEQLQTMRQMGLTNDSLNLNVLRMTNGVLTNAVNLLLALTDAYP